jgi:hypothetical protein
MLILLNVQIHGEFASLSLCESDQLPKTGFIIDSHVSEDLPIQLDASGLQPVYESAVSESVQSGGGVNSRNPKSSKIAFACATMCVGVIPALLYRFHSGTLEIVSATPVAFGMLEHPTAPFTSDIPCFYSCHLKLLSRPALPSAIASTILPVDVLLRCLFGHSLLLMNEAFQAFLIARVDKGRLPQSTFLL